MRYARVFSVLLVFFSLWIASPSIAGRDSLVVGMKSVLPSLSPTDSIARQTLVLCHNWADTLVYRDPEQNRIVPCLAESYRAVNEHTLEFTLRPGVRFHNGEPLTAEAVRFSMEVFKSPDALTRTLFAPFKAIAALDERTVRIATDTNLRAALEILANSFFIYPPDYYRRVGGKAFGRHPVGTGPYRFVSWDEPDRICFEANPEYMGPPKQRPKIPKLILRSIEEQLIRIEALLKGEVDLLRGGEVSPEQAIFLEQHEGISVQHASILRAWFLTMDARGRTGLNAFKDVRVRQALNHAIDRERLVKDVLRGFAEPSRGPGTPLHFGYEPEVRTYDYDPDRARMLLAEAGYADGFTVDFYVVNEESPGEAISRDLEAVGIRTRPHWAGCKSGEFYKMLQKGEVPLGFITWGSYSIHDASAILNPFFQEGGVYCQGTTPEIDRALSMANRSADDEERKALLSRAQKLICENAFWVPLYVGNSVAAMNKDLVYSVPSDEVDRFFLVEWKETSPSSSAP